MTTTPAKIDVDALREQFPHGHPGFLPLLLEKAKLHSDKNHDYAKGGNPLGNFERVAAVLALYPGLPISDPVVVMLVYALKQIDAVLWGLAQAIDHKVEGPIDRLGDVLVYAGIAICALQDRASGVTLRGPKPRLSDVLLKQDSADRGKCTDPDCAVCPAVGHSPLVYPSSASFQ